MQKFVWKNLWVLTNLDLFSLIVIVFIVVTIVVIAIHRLIQRCQGWSNLQLRNISIVTMLFFVGLSWITWLVTLTRALYCCWIKQDTHERKYFLLDLLPLIPPQPFYSLANLVRCDYSALIKCKNVKISLQMSDQHGVADDCLCSKVLQWTQDCMSKFAKAMVSWVYPVSEFVY